MSPELSKQLSAAISIYYSRWLNACKRKSLYIGMYSYSEDILHDALLLFLQSPEKHIQSVLCDEIRGDKHLYNIILSIVDHKTVDKARAKRSIFNINNQYNNDSLICGTDQIKWEDISEEDYAKFRDVSCNIRNDDFITPLPNGMYVRLKKGWVSGWIHSYCVKNKRYTYWLYSAFVGSRGKGEKPRKLKTSSSRHEAYMALMDYNRRFCEK